MSKIFFVILTLLPTVTIIFMFSLASLSSPIFTVAVSFPQNFLWTFIQLLQKHKRGGKKPPLSFFIHNRLYGHHYSILLKHFNRTLCFINSPSSSPSYINASTISIECRMHGYTDPCASQFLIQSFLSGAPSVTHPSVFFRISFWSCPRASA